MADSFLTLQVYIHTSYKRTTTKEDDDKGILHLSLTREKVSEATCNLLLAVKERVSEREREKWRKLSLRQNERKKSALPWLASKKGIKGWIINLHLPGLERCN